MKKVIQFLLPILLLVGALMVARQMIAARKPPTKAPTEESIVPVSVHAATKGSVVPLIRISGTVVPARQIELRAQVGGQITEMHPSLQPGGFFEAGQQILKIDDRDYTFAVQRREAEVERARFELKTEEGQATVASREWELLGKELQTSEAGKELSLRLPHLRRAKANMVAAESSLDEAKLNLERTAVTAPFNGQVRMENVDLGQVITPQTVIATIAGTDRYWVRASIPVDQLSYLQLPGMDQEGGAEATVIMSSGEMEIRKPGRIVRLLGDLDQAGRMARLLIAVDDPMGLESDSDTLPLLLDAFVTVEIAGKPIDASVALPGHTLHEGNKVWVVDSENRLEIRQVKVAWEEKDRILLNEGIEAGEKVITSRIATPLPGLKLRVLAEDDVKGGSSE